MIDNGTPAISVVMPVYNTEKYVSRAIESILNQTFFDFELLIIDNGSTDESGNIIDEYAERDNRIRVIKNEENMLISEARNKAMDVSKGQYLYFIDSDDWVLPDMLETVYKRAKEYNAQYVVTGYFMDYCIKEKEYSFAVCPDDRFFQQNDFRKNAINYLTRTLLTVPWNKLYEMDYLRKHNIHFRNTKLEDHHFNMDVIMDVERVCMVSNPFYHYYRTRQNTDSALVYNKYLNQKKRDHFRHTLAVYRHWGIADEETMGKLANYHLGRLVQCVAQTVGNKTIDRIAKYREIQVILDDDLTKFAIDRVNGESLKIKILSLPIKIKSRELCYAMGKCVELFKDIFPVAYYKMCAGIAQKAVIA